MITSNIRIVGRDDNVLPVHGDDALTAGIVLGQGQVKGLWDAPIKTIERSPARMDGGQLRGVRNEIREVSLGFQIRDPDNDFAAAESTLSQLFTSEPDIYDDSFHPARIEWETDTSGTRFLEVYMAEGEEFEPDIDPISRNYGNIFAHLKAYMPFWQSAPDVSTWNKTGSGTKSESVTAWNPTPLPCLQMWVVSSGAWVLPDVSWRGKPNNRVPGGLYPNRTVALPADLGGGKVSLNPADLMVRDSADTNALGRMPVTGQYFMHTIPPHTPPTNLTVSVTSPGAATVSLVMPRRWRKPYGGEWR